jgi:hypothetical protein
MNKRDVQVILNPNPDRASLGRFTAVSRTAFSLPRTDLGKTDDAPFSSEQLTSARRGWIMRLETSLRTTL